VSAIDDVKADEAHENKGNEANREEEKQKFFPEAARTKKSFYEGLGLHYRLICKISKRCLQSILTLESLYFRFPHCLSRFGDLLQRFNAQISSPFGALRFWKFERSLRGFPPKTRSATQKLNKNVNNAVKSYN
jgi:hypothetical protein